jgi:hypothetical protein
MKMKRVVSWLAQALVLATIVAGNILAVSGSAVAESSYGSPSISYSGVDNPPTSDKPQSKLWWNDGSWWADMWTSGSGWHIYRLDRGTDKWVDTGVRNDSRRNTLADTLWDGSHLYIASHVVTLSGEESTVPSASGQPARLYRYSYADGKYTLDSGFPTVITNNSSESMTIAKDSTGVLWATWTQVSGSSASGFTSAVYANNSAPGGTSWAAPFVLPVSDPNPAPDDISSIVAYGGNKIGVMWSDELTGSVWWATRTDGTAPAASSSWKLQSAVKGKGLADDHLNLKSLQADASGRVFASVKTGLDAISSDPTLPQTLLLVFKPGTGAFTQSTISTTGDCVTRQQLVLDPENNLVHVFQTAPSTSVSGCAYTGVAGSIYEKTASMDNPVFASGRGTPVIQDASSANMNDVTTSKQPVNRTTGIVVLASDHVAKRYWFSDRQLGTSTSPTAPGAFVPVSPSRVLDTRKSNPVGADSSVSFQVGGVSGIPAKVSAVVFNLTVTEAKSFGFITAYASGTNLPNASNQNFSKGQTVANSVTVPVGADGKVTLFNRSSGTTQLIADVAGYYLAGTPVVAGAFAPLAPSRLLDTRKTNPVGADSSVSFQVGGVSGIPAKVSAVVFNLTVTEAKSFGFTTAFASGTSLPSLEQNPPRPDSGELGHRPGGRRRKSPLFNRSSALQLIADVAGYHRRPGRRGSVRPWPVPAPGPAQSVGADWFLPGRRCLRNPGQGVRGRLQPDRDRAEVLRVHHRPRLRDKPAQRLKPELLPEPDGAELRHRPGRHRQESLALQPLLRHDATYLRRRRLLPRRHPLAG